MEEATAGCEGLLSGTRNVHLRLLASALLGAGAASLWHGGAAFSWIWVAGMSLLALGAGLATLWSP